MPAFKALVREQYFMLLIDEEAALAAIPGLLPESIDDRRAAFATLREVLRRAARSTTPRPSGWTAWPRSSASSTEPVTLVPRGASTVRKAS